MPSFHPSQQIQPQFEEGYTHAILQSLRSPLTMIGELKDSKPFPPASLSEPKKRTVLNFNQKLGHLYEDALALLLEETPRYEVIAKNRQIINQDKRTLGELDYILFDRQSQSYIHLELAVKFYLVHSQNNSWIFPGPDARDNYRKKVERLCQHQLQLTNRPETTEVLEREFEILKIQPQHLIHGIFFDHIHANAQASPEDSSLFSRRSQWLYTHEVTEHLKGETMVRVLPKALWLCEIPENLFNSLVLISIAELCELAEQRCTMCLTTPLSKPFFVAPSRWPSSLNT